MARSDPWHRVSTPRWARTSWEVTSVASEAQTTPVSEPELPPCRVHSSAWVATSFQGFRISTQRIGTGGLPQWRQTAVCEAIPTVRTVPSGLPSGQPRRGSAGRGVPSAWSDGRLSPGDGHFNQDCAPAQEQRVWG